MCVCASVGIVEEESCIFLFNLPSQDSLQCTETAHILSDSGDLCV